MNGRHLATLAFTLVVALIAGVVTYLYIHSERGRVSHEAYMPPETALRGITRPSKVQRYISKLAPAATRYVSGVPRLSSMQGSPLRVDWIHALPYEFTFLAAESASGALAVTLFVNPHPDSENFTGIVNRSRFFRALGLIGWTPAKLSERETGAFTASGLLELPRHVEETMLAAWPQYAPVSPPAATIDHFIEVAANNANGAIMAAHGALAQHYGAFVGAAFHDELGALWPLVRGGRLTADLEGSDALRFRVELDCIPGEDAAAVRHLANAAGHLAAYLDERRGYQLREVENGASDAGVVAEYLFTGFEHDLRRLLGG